MPELPEVETIRNDLKNKILGKTIARLVIRLPRIVKNNPKTFVRELVKNKFKEINRIGKLLIFRLERGEKFLLVHLKMTGQLIYCAKDFVIAGGHSLPAGQAGLPKLQGCLPNKYSRVIFYFANKSALFFNDLRTFGYLKIVNKNELEKVAVKFGVDPLSQELTPALLKRIFKKRQTNIKAVLINQELIAGIGNIYADEILFTAGVRPDRKARSLRVKEIEKVTRAMKSVLTKAIRFRGTTFNDYADAQGNQGGFAKRLKVYGRTGEKCSRCGGIIIKKKIAGRGTHFCPKCQK